MKKFKIALSLISFLLFIASCHGKSVSTVRLKGDGQVFSGDGKKIQLDLQSIYDAVEYKDKTYAIGFKTAEDGINIPYVAEVSADLSTINYWPFNTVINDIFVYKDLLYINDIAGKVLVFNATSWQPSDLIFPENSKVVLSDSKNSLVVCYSAALPKIDNHNSGCYSIMPNWKYEFTWFSLEPKVCNNSLYTFEEKIKGGVFRALSVSTGEVLFSKVLNDAPKNLCDVK